MHYYLITGTSTGLGRALAQTLLEAPDTVVIGIARRCTIEHPRYRHHSFDLIDVRQFKRRQARLFGAYEDATSFTLINNAAVVGDIGYIGQLQPTHFDWVFEVNVLAPARLMDAFLTTYTARAIPLTILNISSGAAQRPIDGWAAYCASKAALEMLTRTVAAEQTLLGNTHIRLHALSPGVIDTPMQAQIRAADAVDFSQIEHFRALHQNGELAGAGEVARRIVAFLRRPVAWPEVVVSLREVGE